MSEFPAVFRNAAGDRLTVPNIASCPVGFYRDPDAGPPQPEASTRVELKRDENFGYGDNEGNGSEPDALEAMKGFGR